MEESARLYSIGTNGFSYLKKTFIASIQVIEGRGMMLASSQPCGIPKILMTICNLLFFSYVTDPSITQLTKLIEGEPEFKIVREGETITKVIHGG